MVVKYKTQYECRTDEVFNFESVYCGVVRRSESPPHEVDDIDTTSDEEHLHDGVIQRIPVPSEEVEVTCNEHDNIEGLGL